MKTTYRADHDTTATDPIVTHWTSADGQRDIAVTPAPLSEALAEMLDNGTDEDAAWIIAGSFHFDVDVSVWDDGVVLVSCDAIDLSYAIVMSEWHASSEWDSGIPAILQTDELRDMIESVGGAA